MQKIIVALYDPAEVPPPQQVAIEQLVTARQRLLDRSIPDTHPIARDLDRRIQVACTPNLLVVLG